MSVSRFYTWVDGEVLFQTHLNAEFDNILSNGESLAWPATASKNLAGQTIIMDAAGVSLFRVSVANTLQYVNQTKIHFQVDSTTTTPVTGVSIVAGAAATAPIIQPINEAGLGLNMVMGTGGKFQIDGKPYATHTDAVLGAEVFGR